jgi:hypothetical protein
VSSERDRLSVRRRVVSSERVRLSARGRELVMWAKADT